MRRNGSRATYLEALAFSLEHEAYMFWWVLNPTDSPAWMARRTFEAHEKDFGYWRRHMREEMGRRVAEKRSGA